MKDYAGLGHTLARMPTAWSLAEIWTNVKEYAERLGYSYVVAVDAARIPKGLQHAAIYTDASREMIAAIDRDIVYQQHPLVKQAQSTCVPFLVSDLLNHPNHAGARWTELISDPIKQGDGLMIPIYRDKSLIALTSFGGYKPDTSIVARSMLQVLSYAAVERAFELRTADLPPPAAQLLTARETQCLRMVAQGHVDIEIGKALDISPRTVRFHIDSAKTKLGVTTRIQAVAKALRERIITI